jgi:hypothetical protein
VDEYGEFGVGGVLVEDEEEFGLEDGLELEELVGLVLDFGEFEVGVGEQRVEPDGLADDQFELGLALDQQLLELDHFGQFELLVLDFVFQEQLVETLSALDCQLCEFHL